MNRVFIILLICIILYDLYDCDIIEGAAINIVDFNKLASKLASLRPDDATDGDALVGDTLVGDTDGDTDDGTDGGATFGGTYDGPTVGNIQLNNESHPPKNNILDLTSKMALENRGVTPSINTTSVTDDQNNTCIIS